MGGGFCVGGVVRTDHEHTVLEGAFMAGFPRSLREFQQRFPDDASCAEHLAATRWPEGFRCPGCAGAKAWRLACRPVLTFACTTCGKETSVTAGTVMHRSHLPLSVWFWAAFLMATHSNGMSAVQLKSELGLGSYKTAWLLAMKLRRAMVAPGRTPLAGLVEVDETEIPFRTRGDPPAGGRGRSHQGKLLVVGAVEIESRAKAKLRLGRIRLAPISSFSANTLHAFIRANIVPGATAKTDGLASYLGAPGVTHEPHTIGSMAAHVVMPAIHLSLLQPEDLGSRRLSRPAQEASEGLPRRVRLPFQSTAIQTRRLRHPPRSRRHPHTHHLQDADLTGLNGMSSFSCAIAI